MQNVMSNWFQCKVKYVKVTDDGKEKKVTESFLIDAVSFTEAETRIYTELEKMIHSDFIVTAISRSNIAEIFPNEDGDRYFKAKTTFISLDEESGKEKKAVNYMLVEANNVDDAYKFLKEALSDMLVPFEIPSVSESPIMDVFTYSEEAIPGNLKPVKEIEVDSINVVCVQEAIDATGQRIMQFTEGSMYNAVKVEDPEGWLIVDDNESIETFFALEPMFEKA